MTRPSAVAAARAARAVRGLWPGRNPLRRTIDRIEAVEADGLVVAFLAGAPLAGVAGGHAAYGSGARIAHAQQAAWHQVPTALLATAPAARYRQDQVDAQARWTARTGPGVPARFSRPRVPELAAWSWWGWIWPACRPVTGRSSFRRRATRPNSLPSSPPLLWA